MGEVKFYEQMLLNPITGQMSTLRVVLAADHDAKVAELQAENAKLRAELERRAPDDHTEQALAMVPIKPTQAMISAGWKVGLMGMDRDGPQAIYAAMLAAATSAPKADDPVKQMLLEFVEGWLLSQGSDENYMTIKARAAIAAARNEGGKV